MKCEICGAVLDCDECPCCHGSGEDPDPEVVDGRYVYHDCWVCGGTGEVQRCPDEENDAHQAYDREELRKFAEAEASEHE